MSQKEILERLQKAVEEMESDIAAEVAREAIEAGIDPFVAIEEGLSKGMQTISELFDEGEVFVPQLLLAAEAFEVAIKILSGAMPEEMKHQSTKGKILIHTVEGDIHDIGKNIVSIMLAASGFEVIDMGRDVLVDDVIKKAKELEVDIIAGSALMTTTMPAQREIIKVLEEEGIRDKFKCIFGGAPVSQEWVDKIGADAYAETASEAVEKIKELLSSK